ncbi:hypothetical protein NBE98_03295 [Clostridium swellfunianum]|uniref:hypothetical protein n=1 Tax=Clostridium swellfunianum TaxID=1367462 RepID=UPI00202EBEF1|nr:hypothetical protein [Clostridium swellfunianum]MCM0647401.1 hypothetical protein [Clostridium swellfunianum]
MHIKRFLSLFLFFVFIFINTTSINAESPITLKNASIKSLSTQNTQNYQPIALDFVPSDSVIDLTKPIIYLTDSGRKRLYSINYLTRQTTFIQFDLKPERMVIFNNQLYVTLLITGHQYYSETPEKGAVAIINLDTFTQTQLLKMNFDPYDIAVDKNGYIYLTPGSNQWNKIKSYSSSPTQPSTLGYITEISSITAYMSNLALMHPTLNKLYTITTAISPRDISVNTFNDSGVFGEGYDSPYHGDYEMSTVFKISPDGKYILNGAGTIFSSSPVKESDMKFVLNLNSKFNDAAFDLTSNLFFTAALDKNLINVYNYETFTIKGTIDTSAECEYLFYRDNNLVAVTNSNNSYSVETIPVSSMKPIIADKDDGIKMYGTVIDTVYDSSRNKAYSIDTGLNNLFVLNLSGNSVEKTIKLPYKPSAISLSEDYTKLYIANNDSNYLITVVDLKDYTVQSVKYSTPMNYADYANKKIYQKGDKLYILTGEWAPKLLVFNSSTLERLSSCPELEGVGGLAFSSDGKYLYTWYQYGWNAGSANSYMTKYQITDTSLIQLSEGNNVNFQRDPLNTPILLVEDENILISKGCIFNLDDLSINTSIFPEAIYARNSTNTFVSSKRGIYDLTRDIYLKFIPEGEYDVKFFSNTGVLYLLNNNSLYYIIPKAGDTNCDALVDIKDLAFAAKSYNANKGNENFDVSIDLNYDDIIDIYDLVTISKNLN